MVKQPSPELRKKFASVCDQLEDANKRPDGFSRTAAIEFFKTGAAEFFLAHNTEIDRLLWPEPSAAELDEMTTEPAPMEKMT